MSTYYVSVYYNPEATIEQEIEANYFTEEKGWIIFTKNNKRVAAFRGDLTVSVIERQDEEF